MKKAYLLFICIMHAGLIVACKKNDTISNNKMNSINIEKINQFTEQNNGDTYTKLGIACKENKLSEVKDLLSKGADVNLAKTDDIYEYDALYVAIENNRVKIVEYLSTIKVDFNKIYTEEGLTPVALAVKLNEKEILDILIKKGANINAANVAETDYTYIPILIAVENNNLQIAKKLIDNGVNMNIHDQSGNSIKSLISKKGKEWSQLIP